MALAHRPEDGELYFDKELPWLIVMRSGTKRRENREIEDTIGLELGWRYLTTWNIRWCNLE
jgi:hypothetical protein